MDLSYPPDAEEFRVEIRAWLEENLPAGWFDEGFEMTADERAAFKEAWEKGRAMGVEEALAIVLKEVDND